MEALIAEVTASNFDVCSAPGSGKFVSQILSNGEALDSLLLFLDGRTSIRSAEFPTHSSFVTGG
jgi:hypothetical protein